jgi:hypothetical protein
MSLQHAAKYLAEHGRGPDTTLVHMSKKEVKSLNDLAMAHGGHLTINPSTGLPEAGFLDKMLPAIIGGGLAIATGGTSLALTPGMIGLGVGGFETLRTGDLKKGLMAGLGAYGGAGLAGGLAAAGTGAIGQEATNQAVQNATAQNLQGEAYNQAIQNQVSNQMAGVSTLDKLGAGITSPGMTMNALGGGLQAASTLGAAAAPAISEALEPEKRTPTPVDSDPGQQYDYVANPTMPTPTASPYGTEQKYFSPQYVKRTTPRFADGGISDAHYNLGSYSDGGRLLRGPGDGVSDSIPAVIGKKQPARLADGEFVVPARIVSELGNGSTEAGARKLYAMMDRIQSARGKTVGKGKVAKNSRSEKYLPA